MSSYIPTLYLLRGAPGCGKSTAARAVFDAADIISTDALRMMYTPVVPDIEGAPSLRVGQRGHKRMAQMLEQIVTARIDACMTTVLDSTDSTKGHPQLVQRALDMGMRVRHLNLQGQMTNAELVEMQEARRGSLSHVAPEVVERMADSIRSTQRHGEILLDHDPQAAAWQVRDIYTRDHLLVPTDLQAEGYDKVMVVGDVQSCATELQSLVNAHDDSQTFWIFVGDLFDRGPDAAGVWHAFTGIPAGRRVLVRGNHERNMLLLLADTARLTALRKGEAPENPTESSWLQLKAAGIKHLALQQGLAGSVLTFAFTLGDDHTRVVTHAGITGSVLDDIAIPDGAVAMTHRGRPISGTALMYGSGSRTSTYNARGDYDHDTIAHLAPTDLTQYHGHRNGNRQQTPQAADTHERLFTCEASVESGGHLPVVLHQRRGDQWSTDVLGVTGATITQQSELLG